MTKAKIEVHTPFNLVLPEVVGGEAPFQKFHAGTHIVSKEVAAHTWVKQHSKLIEIFEEHEQAQEDEASSEEELPVAEDEGQAEEPAEEEEEQKPRFGRRR